MSYKLFDGQEFESIDHLAFDDFDERSQDMIKYVTFMINILYDRDYDARDAASIESDGSPGWFYIGFPEENTETHDGYKYYFMHGGKYDDPDSDGNIGVQSCSDYYNNLWK